MLSWFKKVTFTCNHCGTTQRIPLRRVHFFEKFHELRDGQPVLIRCSACSQGLQTPSPYYTHTGHSVEVNPERLARNAVIHSHYC